MVTWNGRIIIPLGGENLNGHFMCYLSFKDHLLGLGRGHGSLDQLMCKLFHD
jgi:hypothetical protein